MQGHDNGKAIGAMLIAMAGFILNDALVKLVSDTLPIGQIIMVRSIFCVLAVGFVCHFQGVFQNTRMLFRWSVLLRGLAETAATLFYLTALFQLPIGNSTAILQALPLVVTAIAAVWFREHVGWRRWTAISIGFLGVLVIVRPGLAGFNAYALFALAAVFCMAVRDLATREVPKEVPSLVVALVSFVLVTLLGGGLTLSKGWQPMDINALFLLLGSAAFIIFGYYFLIFAMRIGDISVVAPYRYSIVLWAIGLGYLIWGDVPDQFTILGTAIVVATGIYTFFRERRS